MALPLRVVKRFCRRAVILLLILLAFSIVAWINARRNGSPAERVPQKRPSSRSNINNKDLVLTEDDLHREMTENEPNKNREKIIHERDSRQKVNDFNIKSMKKGTKTTKKPATTTEEEEEPPEVMQAGLTADSLNELLPAEDIELLKHRNQSPQDMVRINALIATRTEMKRAARKKAKRKREQSEKSKAAVTTISPKPRDTKNTPCPNVHTFYYPWYSNPKIDGHYSHWNHPILPHWDKEVDKQYDKTPHQPPNDIGSNFYPELGPYSSKDPKIIAKHFQQLVDAGIGTIVVSYYPVGAADDNGKPWDEVYHLLLDQAVAFGIKVTFHIEPYKNRNENTVRNDIVHIIDTYGHHKAFYKYKIKDNALVPLFYIYDSYLTKPEKWARVLKPDGPNTIRGSKYDAVMIGLLVELHHTSYASLGGFDGLYTYFATDGFTYGSTWNNWRTISSRAVEMNFMHIPSVGPGYIDTNIRPWNAENTRERYNGQYYKNSWQAALHVSPKIISITSFNEWHEGTQIERAVPKSTAKRTYLDYKHFGAGYYLKLTKHFVNEFSACKAH